MNYPTPASTQRPAATQEPSPIGDYLASAALPGISADNRYLVLPRIVLEHLPLPLQQDLVQILSRIHQMSSELPWPQAYRVEAARRQTIGTLDEAGLRELGVIAELAWNGDLIYRDQNTGRPLSRPELTHPTPVSTPDPLY